MSDTGISVTASGTKVVTRESVKIVFTAGFAYAASMFVHSDLALAVVLPAGGVVAVWLMAVLERVHHWKVIKALADLVPDEVAKVERKP